MNFKHKKHIIEYLITLSIMILCNSSSAQEKTSYTVDGNVFLEEQSDHSGVKVKFYNLPSMVPEDSTSSQSSGYYTTNVSPGYYLVEWTKDGYVPWELGGLALASDTTLTDVTLIPGQVLEVSGNVSGNWTTGYVYYVMGNITVPAGDSLIIDAGVRAKFSSGTGMVCNGTLKANGTGEAHVLFTSREPTPLPGDWDNIELYTENNVLTYVDYEWASDGIVADNASGTTIDNLYMVGSLSLTANGLYFTNSTNLTFTNNSISVAGDYSIYAHDSHNSTISNNTLGHTGSRAISAHNSDGTTFSGNTINGNPSVSIYAPYSDNAEFLNNIITTSNNGIEAQEAGNNGVTISGNTITGFKDYGIYFNNSPNSTITDNIITSQTSSDYDMRGISGNSPNSLISGNEVTIDYDVTWENRYHYGIDCNQSTITENTIYVEGGYDMYPSYGFGIRADNSIISNNIIDINMDYTTSDNWLMYGIESNGTSTITNNTIRRLRWKVRAISTSGDAIISGNKIIYAGSPAGGEENAYAIYTGTNTVVSNDSIIGMPYGIHIQDDNGVVIDSNYIDVTYHGIYISKSSADLTQNLIKSSSGRGIHCENQSGEDFSNNTIIGSGGDYGIYITNLSAPTVRNNIIHGFQNGIYDQNDIQNYNLMHNNFWQISGNLFEGSALPPLVGQMIDINANGDPSDIYNNINLDPQFVYPDTGNYHLQVTSPCINAGDPNLSDPDGTVSDIGAFPFDINVVIEHTPLGTTIDTNGPYTVSATIYSPAGYNVTASLFYRINGGSFVEVAMTDNGANNFTGDIPGQAMDTQIDYYITASDGENVATNPYDAPNEFYTFYVTLVEQFSALSGNSLNNGDIQLSWTTPDLFAGTLTGYRLYKSETSGITEPDLLISLSDTITGFIDMVTFEGTTYYYRLGGTINTGTETVTMFLSNEISVISDEAGIVFVSGYVLLENSSDYSDILVEFERTSPTPVTYDTVYTDVNGYYWHLPAAGIYNINFKKYGWQPGQLGAQYLTQNITLDTLILEQGYAQYVGGEVSGTWTKNNIYYVTSTITVPEGDTLTIQAGTKVRFTDFYSFMVNGTLIADGDSLNHIEFTSGKPVPHSGDWGSLIIQNNGSLLRYLDYSYATTGINGENASGIVIDHCSIKNLTLDANGIYFDNSKNINVSNTYIDVTGVYGIYAPDADNSKFDNNTIVSRPDKGIYAPNADSTMFSGNTLEVLYNGFECANGSYLTFTGNTITEFEEYGIYFQSSEISTLTYNRIISSTNSGGWKRGINNTGSNQNAVVNYNYISVFETTGGNYIDQYGIEVHDSEVVGDSVFVYINGNYGSDGRGIRADRSTISGNYINIQDHYESGGVSYGIESYGNSSNRSSLKNNTIIATRESRGIWASYADIENNHIEKGPDNNNDEWAIGHGDYNIIKNNTIIGMRDGIYMDDRWSNVVENNQIETRYWGIYANNSHGTVSITNNTINKYTTEGNWFIYVTNPDSVIIAQNEMRGSGGSGVYVNNTNLNLKGNLVVTPGRGFDITNQVDGSVLNNTIIGTSNGDYGIYITDLSSPDVSNNIIQGFQTGIRAESEVTVITNNDLWTNTTNFSGSGLPALIGEVVTVNVNGDPCDVHSNLLLDPQFVGGNDYHILSTSPCINAGVPTLTDLDGTVSDIGAYFYNFGYAPMDLVVDSTGNGFVAISWDIIETDSLSGFQPYYKLSSEDNYTTVSQTTNNYCTFTGLTNNVSYDFAASAIYINSESNLSRYISEKSGIAKMVISPRTLIAIHDVGDTTYKSFTIQNTGTKDLSFTINPTINYGTVTFTKIDYADWTQSQNQDRITENVWITRQNNRGVFNAAKESSYQHGISPRDTEWSYGYTRDLNPGDYKDWRSAVNNHPPNMVNQPMSLHLISDDLYFDIVFHSWSQGGGTGGGFSYTRTHILESGENYVPPTSGLIGLGQSYTFNDTLAGESYGIETKKITINSNDPNRLIDSVNVLNITGTFTSLQPNNFTPVDTTSKFFYFVVEYATIDDQSLQTGDEIALFDGELCVGAAGFNGVFPFVMQAFGANGDSLGFTSGDSIKIKLWDFSRSRYGTGTANYTFGDGTFQENGFARINLEGSIYQSLYIPITANRFNLISTYLYPKYTNIASIFGNLSNLKIVYEDNGSAYIPEYGINTIGDIDITEGYHLFIADDDQELVFQGMSIDPQNWQIILNKNQFNSIAYLYDSPMSVEYAFSDIVDYIEIIQDDDGGAWIPSMEINTIGDLQPLSGYQVFTNAENNVTFTYPSQQKGVAKEEAIAFKKPIPTSHFQYIETGLPYTVVITSALIDNHPFENGDEVGIFYDGNCVGATVWDSDKVNIITAWKGNEDLNVPGFSSKSPITFRAFSKRFNSEFETDAAFQSEDQQYFEGAAYSIVSLKGAPGLIPQKFALHNNYPNPFNATTVIPYDVPDNTEVTLVIYNILGKEVDRLLDKRTHSPGTYNITWNGTNKYGNSLSSGLYFIRMITPNFHSVHKLVLLK